MCGASKPPTPQAPPAPVPQRESKIDGLRTRQTASAAARNEGYESTILSAPTESPAPAGASPTLGR